MDVTADNDAAEICRSAMAGVDGGSLDCDEALVYWERSDFVEMTRVALPTEGRW